MKVVGFAGYSGSGKTTLVEQLIPALKLRGLRVSIVKHAHHSFDIDHPAKDTYRHREAGAFEVVVASQNRLALMREFEQPAALTVHHLIAELYEGVDWVLVEGFKDSDLLKIEVWRAPSASYAGKPARYMHDDFIVAIATDAPGQLPEPTLRPVLDLNNADAVADYLVNNQERFDYSLERRLD
jgi:molybdopterin-guanine dinucleotide biosynthesis protein B